MYSFLCTAEDILYVEGKCISVEHRDGVSRSALSLIQLQVSSREPYCTNVNFVAADMPPRVQVKWSDSAERHIALPSSRTSPVQHRERNQKLCGHAMSGQANGICC